MTRKIIYSISITYILISLYALANWSIVTVTILINYQDAVELAQLPFASIDYWRNLIIDSMILIGGIGLLRFKNWSRKLLITALAIEILFIVRVMLILNEILILNTMVISFYFFTIVLLFHNKFKYVK